MVLKIDDKTFIGRYNKKGELIILLEAASDVWFFRRWTDKKISAMAKKDYVKNVEFIKVVTKGILTGCFPILSLNEDKVKLVYDFANEETIFETTF